MSQQNTPATPSSNGVATIPSEPRNPIALACTRVFDAFKGGNNCEVLQAFDELQAMDLENCHESQSEILGAWGRGVLAASQMCSDDEEHLLEMVDDYEGRFGTRSPFLRVLLENGSSPSDCLLNFLSKHPPPEIQIHSPLREAPEVEAVKTIPPLVQPRPTPTEYSKYVFDAIEGVTEKFRNFSCSDAVALIDVARRNSIEPDSFPIKLVEKLQRPFTSRMKSKTEDVEVVFDDMVACGLKPVNPIPFSFIFLKQQPTKPLMDHYYLMMLSCGVKPVDSIFRLLSRNNSLTKEELHFVRRRMAGVSDMEENGWYDKKLSMLRSIENDRVYDDATRLFLCMLEDDVVPTKHAFNKIIAMARHDPAMAEAWYRKMIDMGVQPNALTFTTLVSLWKHYKLSDSVERWISEMTTRGMQLDTANYILLLEGYVRTGSRSRAQNCFRALLARGDCNLHVYNLVMSLGPFDWAFGCLAALLSDGFEPNGLTIDTLVSLAKDEISSGIVDQISARGWSKSSILTNPVTIAPARGTSPSLFDSMRMNMREMKMSDDDIKRRTEMLSAEVDIAKRK